MSYLNRVKLQKAYKEKAPTVLGFPSLVIINPATSGYLPDPCWQC